ncbi:hypothetical protein BS47DRAFT_1344946 [Hydnum rufescens UP504]|uniref:Uncharacterized protein n=1 Tax=Hydnum rufescens UP504 TaxID=1448309 RepID=A0A9P6AWV0_9AGAM|nr:hypothetical protein BS47DRAFT_1344946 [Hydnum rufescens UP504]
MSSPSTAAASTLATDGSLASSKANADDPPGSSSDSIHTLPSTETEGALPSSGPIGGVGALPGPITEEGVALLPEERVNPDPLHLDDSQATSGTPTNESNIAPQPPSAAFNTLRLDDPNTNDREPKAAETLAPGSALSPSTLPSHGTEVPPPSSASPASGSASIPVPPSTPVPKSKAPPSSSSSFSSGTNGKKEKVSLMDKIKGEVKIFSGKMANDEAKVEAGKALKNGTGPGGRASPGKKWE